MLRTLIIAAAFLTVTLGLLLLQPGSGPKSQPALENTITRADTDLTTLGNAVALSQAAPAASPTPAATPPAPVATRDSDALRALTNNVLSGLGAPAEPATPAVPAISAEEEALRALTSQVLAGLTPAATNTGSKPQLGLEGLVVQAISEGQSDAYLDALLNEAADRGLIQVPAALVTDGGRVDTPTLISALTQKAAPTPARKHKLPVGGKGVEIRVIQSAGETKEYRFYTVQPGDSLGAIAVKFYGDAAYFADIFNANRQFVPSPDRIRPGQRLTIPVL